MNIMNIMNIMDIMNNITLLFYYVILFSPLSLYDVI